MKLSHNWANDILFLHKVKLFFCLFLFSLGKKSNLLG